MRVEYHDRSIRMMHFHCQQQILPPAAAAISGSCPKSTMHGSQSAQRPATTMVENTTIAILNPAHMAYASKSFAPYAWAKNVSIAVQNPNMVEFQRLNHTVARLADANSSLPSRPTNIRSTTGIVF
mmetsp:Transcript_4297/g.6293  ORF Transcript_4297/g.6293 Transcript_4297/m.6293 type:complete len:126 (-) Transcript_4297:282-659(-)